jgi:NitT/TauT family transport system substrate-binding protein
MRPCKVSCSAGVPPAVFLSPQSAKMPAGRRRYEIPALHRASGELPLTGQTSRKKLPPLNRKLIQCVVLLILLASLAFDASAQAVMKVRVGKAIGEAFSFTPLDIGIETGIFKKHGIEIEKYDFGGSAKLQQALAADSIDMGLGSGPELAFIVKGSPVLGVAAMADAPWLLTLVVDKNGPIHSVSDLKGKTISVSTRGSLTDWLVHDLARQQGWGPDGIKTLPVGTDVSQISALKTHQIDGCVIDLAAAYRLEEEGSTRIVVRFGSLFKDFHIHIIYARRSFIDKNPDAVRAFLAGWFETIAFMRQDKNKTVEISSRVMGVSPAIAGRVYDELMPMFNSTGKYNPKALEVLRRSYVEMGILPTEPDMSQLVTEKFLPSASK